MFTGPRTHITQLDDRQRLLMLAVGFVLLEAALWTSRPLQTVWSLAAALWIILSIAASRASFRELGLHGEGWARSLWIVGAAASVAALIVASAATLGTLQPLFGIGPALPHALLYGIWALQQEFILQCFFFVNLRELFGTRTAVPLSAGLFAFVHLPNPVLTVCTLAMGLALVMAFAHYRNLYVLAIAHALLGLAIAISVPPDALRHMRVGLGWYTYKPSSTTRVRDERHPSTVAPTASATQIVR